MSTFARRPVLSLSLLAALTVWTVAPASAADKPNVVLILLDDLGYGDIRPNFPGTGIPMPNVERMAAEGTRFSDFYAGSSVCSPSRAALLTGSYPTRVGLPAVFEADSNIGLNPDEETLPELLKGAGYTTALIGKWHLGDRPEQLPTRHGFDTFYGLPYSNDMVPNHPVKKNFFPDLPFMEGEKVISYNPDQSQFTRWFTERSVSFIEKNKGKPFFLEITHPMPHVPLYVSKKFEGKSGKGLYGDVLLELDWSVGQILAAIKKNGIENKTIVMFTSDNGPWLSYGTHGGSSGPLRDGKTTTYDGGFRVPFLVRWPGKIPAGRVSRELATMMDLLPTLTTLAGAKQPTKKIDGKNIWPLMTAQAGATTPHEAFYYYNAWQLEAVRSGRWKLVLPHDQFSVVKGGTDGNPGQHAWTPIRMALYDLLNDVGETTDVAASNPQVMTKLLGFIPGAREELGDGFQQVMPEKKDYFQSRRLYRVPGKGQRPAGTATTPPRSWLGQQ
jgi:arylsulfatase A